jgi:hypothetical protein
MAKVALTLIRFAKSRECALRASRALTGQKAKAIAEITRVADFFKGKSEDVQLRAVRQVESYLISILPHPESRFKNQRNQILTLITTCHERFGNAIS